jgi:hypothetical protein
MRGVPFKAWDPKRSHGSYHHFPPNLSALNKTNDIRLPKEEEKKGDG